MKTKSCTWPISELLIYDTRNIKRHVLKQLSLPYCQNEGGRGGGLCCVMVFR